MKFASLYGMLLATGAFAVPASPVWAQSSELSELRNGLAEMQARLIDLQKKMEEAERKLAAAEAAQGGGRAPLPRTISAESAARVGDRSRRSFASDCDSATRSKDVFNSALGESTEMGNDALNAFAADCLGLVKTSQYKAADVAFTAGVAKNDGTFEIAPSYTVRYAAERPYSLKYSASVFSDPDPNDGNRTSYRTFGDELSGTGFGLGLEWARYAKLDSKRNVFANGIAAARRACVAEKLVTSDLAARPVADPLAAAQACEGAKFTEWLWSQGATHWASTLGKLYATDASPKHVAGLSFKKSWRTFKHLTPQLIGALPAGVSFDGLSGVVLKTEVEPWLVKAYFGGSITSLGDPVNADGTTASYWRRIGVGAVFSMTYREEFKINGDDAKQTICGSAGAIARCSAFNLSGPRKLSGVIPAVSFNFALPRGFILPHFGLSTVFSYDSVGDRLGVEVPLYIGMESDKLTAGIKYFYRQEAVLDDGFKLAEDDGFAFFISSKFDLLNGR